MLYRDKYADASHTYIQNVAKWLIENDIDNLFIDITNTKDLAWLYIDDRCLKFDGEYSSLEEQINNFKPWYK